MLGALPQIAARLPGVHIVFACRPRSRDDQQREKAARLAVLQMGLAHAVHFHNVVADMETLIGASDLVALPLQTMRDKIDIPTTLLESLAAGNPVIISDLPPMNELFRDANGYASDYNELGMVVPPGDPDAMGQAIVDLMKHESLRERMGQRGQLAMYERFDIRQVARQYDKLYREMVYRERTVLERPGKPEVVPLGVDPNPGMDGNGRYSPIAKS
jgi:glycosyltransferase involved in cell wall biosynthesis